MADKCGDWPVEAPKEFATITLSSADPTGNPRRVSLTRINLFLTISSDDRPHLREYIIPKIEVWVEYSGGPIRQDSAFEEGVSKALTASLDKPVKVKWITRVDYEAVQMHCVDEASEMSLLDYLWRRIILRRGWKRKPLRSQNQHQN